MVQNGMLWLEHTPATLLWDSSTKRLVGRQRLFVFFFLLLKLSPPLRCLVGARPGLDVPLHVKSQMVRPGETSGDRRGRKESTKKRKKRKLLTETCFREEVFVGSFVILIVFYMK